jgi:L-ribulose-5-phosphate 4-epimerase
VVHTHSTYATAWAQAQLPIPCLGTTHADYVYGAVPCTAIISDEQIKHDYEHETGVQITDCIASDECKSKPMVLVAGHAPFTWGKSASEAVYHSVILEELARMSYFSLTLNPMLSPLKAPLLDKHYLRKHGTNAYYGQEKEHK